VERVEGFRVWRHEGRGLLGRPRRRWDNSIASGLKVVGQNGVGWNHLGQDRVKLAGFCERGDERVGYIKCG
jgi:hypothetical protein